MTDTADLAAVLRVQQRPMQHVTSSIEHSYDTLKRLNFSTEAKSALGLHRAFGSFDS